MPLLTKHFLTALTQSINHQGEPLKTNARRFDLWYDNIVRIESAHFDRSRLLLLQLDLMSFEQYF